MARAARVGVAIVRIWLAIFGAIYVGAGVAGTRHSLAARVMSLGIGVGLLGVAWACTKTRAGYYLALAVVVAGAAIAAIRALPFPLVTYGGFALILLAPVTRRVLSGEEPGTPRRLDRSTQSRRFRTIKARGLVATAREVDQTLPGERLRFGDVEVEIRRGEAVLAVTRVRGRSDATRLIRRFVRRVKRMTAADAERLDASSCERLLEEAGSFL